MYLKFNRDVYHNGKVYKEDAVYYVTLAQQFIDDGSAEEVNYEEWHTANGGKPMNAPKGLKDC